MNKTKVCVFDAYGTLFDVNAACRELSKEVGEQWEELATLWRLRQVEYTWLRNSMNEYVNFWKITEHALEYAMEVLNIQNDKLKNDLLELYLKLEAYPEVRKMLNQLRDKGYKTGILSNGNEEMLDSAVKNAQIENLLDEIISVERCKVYKPNSEVYKLVTDVFEVKKEEVAFFSSNAWDMHAAANYGFKTIWVNRFNGKLERLPGSPSAIVDNLKGITEIV